MPEYLAPGVYVEETSFRFKSIEGVSTSTTGFVGLARKGPVFIPEESDETPELLTSFGDFERIYGGLKDIGGQTSFLAHAVRAYFDNGGRRLFVSRVAELPEPEDEPEEAPEEVIDSGATNGARRAFRARSAQVVRSDDATERVAFAARFPGAVGNGRLYFRQAATQANARTLQSAPLGSLLRLGGRKPAQPARLEAAAGGGPYALANNGRLLLTVGGTEVDITIRSEAAEVVAAAAPADPLTIPAADQTLRVTVGGREQTVSLPAGPIAPAALVTTINQHLDGATARLTPENRLAIATEATGSRASITVARNDTLGFTAEATDENPDNNVADASRVSVDDLNQLLAGGGANLRASVSPKTGRLVLATTTAGEAASVRIRGGERNQNAALGLVVDEQAAGVAGSEVRYFLKSETGWRDATGAPLDPAAFSAALREGADLLTLSVVTEDGDGDQIAYDDLAFDRNHPRWLGNVLAAEPSRRSDRLQNPFMAVFGRNVSAFELRDALFGFDEYALVTLQGGDDPPAPTSDEAYRRALAAFEKIEDISIVAAPDAAAFPAIRQAVHNLLITHVEQRRAYRIAVLDTDPGLTATEALEVRATMDSTRAALYYPWVVVPNPLARPGEPGIPAELAVPASGFVCGIYARNDTERGVWKAPANEVVRGALRFEIDVNFAQQELLNPRGVNCLRYFPGRGFRVWGARTAASDPEWKYVNIRRYFNYLERSIDTGTQWVVFEPNGERLWANVRETIASFLYNEWVSGALLGESPKEAFFVRCDRSTMTQDDLDNGRLICLIGVAAVKPAEFVIFRIGQKTADSRA
jgi:phage tail sheath protein FI